MPTCQGEGNEGPGESPDVGPGLAGHHLGEEAVVDRHERRLYNFGFRNWQ